MLPALHHSDSFQYRLKKEKERKRSPVTDIISFNTLRFDIPLTLQIPIKFLFHLPQTSGRFNFTNNFY